MYYFLYIPVVIAAFVGGKFLGLDGTMKNFENLGRLLNGCCLPAKKLPADVIFQRLTRAYNVLPLSIKCLDQAIVAWFLFNLHKLPAVMKIGMSTTPLESHAWVELGDTHFVDASNIPDLFVVAEYAAWAKI